MRRTPDVGVGLGASAGEARGVDVGGLGFGGCAGGGGSALGGGGSALGGGDAMRIDGDCVEVAGASSADGAASSLLRGSCL